MSETYFERLSRADREYFSGASQIEARNAVMACFYGDNPFSDNGDDPTRDLCDLYDMLVMPRAQIHQALRELLDSEELVQVPGECIPNFRLSDTWKAVPGC